MKLRVEGEVDRPCDFAWHDLAQLPAEAQIEDVGVLSPQRSGGAVRLEAVLERCAVRPSARYLSLHASRDDFHASVPLAAVRDAAVLIYRQGDQPLPEKQGGPLRFLIPDPAACGTHQVDECASVKFVDRLELTTEPGFDNRPADERAHAQRHAAEGDA